MSDYSKIALIPNYSEVLSRKDVDVSTNFCGVKFSLPVIPANMKCVIDTSLIHNVYRPANMFYIMHRFPSKDTNDFVFITNFIYKQIKSLYDVISFSIGVSMEDPDKWIDKLIYCIALNIDGIQQEKNLIYKPAVFITIDVAHGHHKLVFEQIKRLQKAIKKYNINGKIIAGNIGTPEALFDMYKAGVNAVKCGIGPSPVCSTFNNTGFGTINMYEMISILNQFKKDNNINLPIIADGGIKSIGDIAKAINAGADMVMVGSLFAACSDSPAKGIGVNKIYYGSASQENKNVCSYIEGRAIELQGNGMKTEEFLIKIKEGLQSACSYAGGNTLESLRNCGYTIIL